jgi:hypothetical protein
MACITIKRKFSLMFCNRGYNQSIHDLFASISNHSRGTESGFRNIIGKNIIGSKDRYGSILLLGNGSNGRAFAAATHTNVKLNISHFLKSPLATISSEFFLDIISQALICHHTA